MSAHRELRGAPRVAIVADYLNQQGGAEWVVAVLHTMFPGAPVFTTILDRERLWPQLRDADLRVSWMQRLPGLRRHFRKYFLLYPLAVEGFNLADYDLVVSSSCAYGKGARARAGGVHVCYCHTPARFVWNYDAYVERERLGRAARAALPPLIGIMKRWDLKTAGRPDTYVANSTIVADRIRRFYDRPSTVVPPPVDCSRFAPADRVEPYFLIVARLIPYKRIDVAVDAFTRLGLPLRIVGDGPDRVALERRAGPNVTFLGRLPNRDVEALYARCRALVHPGLEDFGIAPVEANASGRPVIAFRGGGAVDTVIEGETGVFFDAQTPEALVDAVERFARLEWDPARVRERSLRFDMPVFRSRMYELLGRAIGAPLGPPEP